MGLGDPHLALLCAFVARDNSHMDNSAAVSARLARIRDWFAKHLVAIVATLSVLGCVGWKNQYHPDGSDGDFTWSVQFGEYGWPQSCVEQNSVMNNFTPNAPNLVSRRRSVESWWGLCLDTLIAIAFLGGTWIVFISTQRNIRNWWQISLSSLLGLVALAGLLFAMQ